MKEKDNSFAIDFPLKKPRSPKINKYIKHYKKSTMGDIISLSKYPYLKLDHYGLKVHRFGWQTESLHG